MSGAVPPPAARPLGRAAGVPRPVCPGCGWCGRGDPAPAPQRAPLRAGVARCGAGGRASLGGVPFAVPRGVWGQALPPPDCPPSGQAVGVRYSRAVGVGVRMWGPCTGPVALVPCGGLRVAGVLGGVRVQAPPLPCCPPSGRAAGARWPHAVGAGVGVCGVCGDCAVRAVVRGVALCLSLWCPPVRCFVAVLCSPCACRAPFAARVPCWAAGYLLFLSWFRRSLPFPLRSVGSPFSLACTFPLPPPWCVSRSFSLPAFLVPVPGSSSFSPVGSCETGEGMGCVGLWAAVRYGYSVTYLRLSLYPRWRHYRCVLRCVACNIPVSALVFTCVRRLFTLLAIPWCLSVAVAVVLPCLLCSHASSRVDGL